MSWHDEQLIQSCARFSQPRRKKVLFRRFLEAFFATMLHFVKLFLLILISFDGTAPWCQGLSSMTAL
jgi:hypothetical protein